MPIVSTNPDPRSATTVQLRNPRTIHRCSYCGAEGRLYPAGKLCDQHAPKPRAADA